MHQTAVASQPNACATSANGVGVTPPSSQKASIRNGIAAVMTISARSLIVPNGWPIQRNRPMVTSATRPATPTTHPAMDARRTMSRVLPIGHALSRAAQGSA